MKRWLRCGVFFLCSMKVVLVVPSVSFAAPPQEAEAAESGEKKADEKGPKPYGEIITEEMSSTPGLFTVHRDGDEVYFEIPAAELGQDMLWVTQIAETQAGFSWAGMPVVDRVVRWERHGDRILLRDVRYDIRADVDDPIQGAVEATSVAPIIRIFEIKTYGEDEAPVIEVSSFFTSDVREFSAKEALDAEGLDGQRTLMGEVKAFPENIETRVLATYKLKEPDEDWGRGPRSPTAIPRDPSQSGVSVVLHHSMVRLPDEPMRPRRWDERVGFFSVGFNDYGDDSEHEVKRVRFITRWRLEKKDPGAELSEPVEPIVWYVSREVPAKWREAFIQGIEDWQPAFEAAGFKNAIVGKIAPTKEEDPDWDPEDVRYTTIRWLPSAVQNAFGPHVHDPRTGEILEADVRMFHNVMKLIRDWYFVQSSPSDPRAQRLPLPDDLMAELVRFVVAHEVGHSLGLPHNMKASSSYSVAQLRDPEFTCRMGTAPSIMDYARFNYVAQPGDGACLMPAVGVYDQFAIEWGYSQFAEAEEDEGLAAIVARQLDDPMLLWGSPNPGEDPTQQTEDLSEDAVEATRLGLLNLERVAANLVEATSSAGDDYRVLENMHGVLLGQWRREMVHVANVVGGVEKVNFYYGDADRRFFPVGPVAQREAMDFLAANAFETPTFFLDPDIVGRLEAAGVADRLVDAQRSVLEALVDERRVKRMSETSERQSDAYTAAEMMSDLRTAVWAELEDRSPAVDLYRRNLQRAHVEVLAERVESSDRASDLPGLARGELTAVRALCRKALARNANRATALHLEDLVARITLALDRVRVVDRASSR